MSNKYNQYDPNKKYNCITRGGGLRPPEYSPFKKYKCMTHVQQIQMYDPKQEIQSVLQEEAAFGRPNTPRSKNTICMTYKLISYSFLDMYVNRPPRPTNTSVWPDQEIQFVCPKQPFNKYICMTPTGQPTGQPRNTSVLQGEAAEGRPNTRPTNTSVWPLPRNTSVWPKQPFKKYNLYDPVQEIHLYDL